MKAQARIDEFVFVLLAGIVMIVVLMVMWTIPTEAPPTVEPSSVSLTLLPGLLRQFSLNISGPITNVSLSASGEIANWISFSSMYFDSIPTYQLVPVYITVPTNTPIKTYRGVVRVSSTGGVKDVPIAINVQNITSVEFLTHTFAVEDFSISFISGSKLLDMQSNVEVSKGYFSENSLNLVGVLEENELKNVINSYIRLVVSDTNKLGNLVVELNGQEVYNRPTDVGEVIIPVNISLLTRSNVAKIKATNPGWMFWANTVYRIREASFSVDFKGVTTKEVFLNLTSQEVSGFNHIKFNSLISYEQPPRLRIKVNEQTVYLGKPPIYILDLWIDKDILGNNLALNVGSDKVVFTLESPGEVSFTNSVLTFNYLP
jgi:hypothetical protein